MLYSVPVLGRPGQLSERYSSLLCKRAPSATKLGRPHRFSAAMHTHLPCPHARLAADLRRVLMMCIACRQFTRPLGHIELRRKASSPGENPSGTFPLSDIFPADRPIPEPFSPGSLSAQRPFSTGVEELVNSDGGAVSVRQPCVGTVSYHVTANTVWTNRTHQGAPENRFWRPLVALSHSPSCASFQPLPVQGCLLPGLFLPWHHQMGVPSS